MMTFLLAEILKEYIYNSYLHHTTPLTIAWDDQNFSNPRIGSKCPTEDFWKKRTILAIVFKNSNTYRHTSWQAKQWQLVEVLEPKYFAVKFWAQNSQTNKGILKN